MEKTAFMSAGDIKASGSFLWCLLLLTVSACSDSPAEKRTKNEQYLDQLAAIVCDYHSKTQKLPASFDDALSESGQTLSHRGDYYRRPYLFLQFQNTAFCFRAKDVDVSYINCKKVSHDAFVNWVRSHLPSDEWEVLREHYDR
ncbi:MAG: hypothetical protein WCO71_10300 [Pseudomonadota bacterium]|jgi:hypothetical protein